MRLLKCIPLLMVFVWAAGGEPLAPWHLEQGGVLVIEGEAFAQSKGYQTISDESAAGGHYVQSGSSVDYQLVVITRGRYVVHLLTRSPDDKGNSCYFHLNGRPVLTPPGSPLVGHPVIQTHIGNNWDWFSQWRENSQTVTIDLEPGVHVLSVSPREPQQLDRFIFQHVSAAKRRDRNDPGVGNPGPPPTLLPLDPGEPAADRRLRPIQADVARLRYGPALTAIDRLQQRGGIDKASAALIASWKEKMNTWIAAQVQTANDAAASGDVLAAVDRLEFLAALLASQPLAKELNEQAKNLRSQPDYQAGVDLWRLVTATQGSKLETWQAGLGQWRTRYADSWYNQNLKSLFPIPAGVTGGKAAADH